MWILPTSGTTGAEYKFEVSFGEEVYLKTLCTYMLYDMYFL